MSLSPPIVSSGVGVVVGGGMDGSGAASTSISAGGSVPVWNSHSYNGQQQQPLVTTPPLVAQGDWTKNLVQLAKTAELKKHALTLQLHQAHIMSAHATLESKNQALQDIKEQKNRLESERTRLLNCLREVNEDRDKADMMESSITKECADLKAKINTIENGEYTTAKRECDALRAELGQPPLPTLQTLLEEKSAAYLNDRRLNGDKRSAADLGGGVDGQSPSGKRPRGRPKGSKNRTKASGTIGDASAVAPS